MSLRALALALRNTLRHRGCLGLTEGQCEVTIDGQPPAGSGELFVAIHEGSWTNTGENHLDELYGMHITVSVRHPRFPEDRVHLLLTEDKIGLWYWCERIRACVHLNYDTILNGANAIIGPYANGFCEPPYFENGGTPRRQGANWFSSKSQMPTAGVSQTLSFRAARRVQNMENVT